MEPGESLDTDPRTDVSDVAGSKVPGFRKLPMSPERTGLGTTVWLKTASTFSFLLSNPRTVKRQTAPSVSGKARTEISSSPFPHRLSFRR